MNRRNLAVLFEAAVWPINPLGLKKETRDVDG